MSMRKSMINHKDEVHRDLNRLMYTHLHGSFNREGNSMAPDVNTDE